MGTRPSQTCLSHWSSSELFSLSGRLPPLSERLLSLIRWSPNLQRAPRWRASRTAATSQSSSKLALAPIGFLIISATQTLEEHADTGTASGLAVTPPGTARRVMNTTNAFVLRVIVQSMAHALEKLHTKNPDKGATAAPAGSTITADSGELAVASM